MAMSNKPNQTPLYPTAPSAADNDDYQRGPPPPSYEESLKMTSPPLAQQNVFPCQQTNLQAQQQQQLGHFPHHHQAPINHAAPAPATLYGYTNPYQAHVLQQQIYYNTGAVAPNHHMSPAQNVLHFDKRADIRTTATGAICVPPPPPGCAPTPGQLAAMTGNSVMVKKEKRGFFF